MPAEKPVAPRPGSLRARVLEHMRAHPEPQSADQIADALGWDRLALRPRISELHAAGLIADSGERGKGSSGKSCVLWKRVE